MQNLTPLPVAILVNDNVLANCISLLESIKRFSPEVPIYYVPYDDFIGETECVLKKYGVNKIDFDFRDIDNLSSKLFPEKPSMKNRLRKLCFFMVPWDRFLYIDVDIVVTSNFISQIGCLNPIQDLVYITETHGWVYEENTENFYDFVKNSKKFSTGCFYCSKKKFNWDNILNFVGENAQEFLSVRKNGVIDQPLVNYYCDKEKALTSSLEEIIPEFHQDTYIDVIERRNAFLQQEGVFLLDGKKVPFVHWAGPEKDLSRRSLGVDKLRKIYINMAKSFLLKEGCSEKLISSLS